MYKVYTDGSSLNKEKLGAYAAIIHDKDEKIIFEKSDFSIDTTNNRMEMQGVIEALLFLNFQLIQNEEIEIISDSQYVIYSINKKWTKEKNRDLWKILAEQTKLLRSRKNKVIFSWVRGHDGNHYNEIVDKKAGLKLKELRSILKDEK